MKSNLKNFGINLTAFFIPILSILILALILYVPRNTYWNFLRQAPFYAGIYFWQSQRPDAFNIISAFFLGLFADVLGCVSLGINIISFLSLYLIAVQCSIRFNIKRFSYSWMIFATALLLTLLFKAIIVSAQDRTLIPLNFLGMEFLLTVAVYPLMARYYMWAERRYIHLEERYEKIEP